MNPKVSIVIPVYNGSNYLKEAIDSALAQTYNHIEIIVVNDGSTDNGATEKIAKSYGDKIRYFAKENGGVATALNLGIEKMTGEYFSWLSHDDLYYPEKIEKQIKYLDKLKNKNVVLYSNYEVIDESGKFLYDCRFDHKMLSEKQIYALLRGKVNGITMLVPKKAFDDYGGFDASLRCTQDYDLWYKMIKTYPFVHMTKILTATRVHSLQDTQANPSAVIEGNILWKKMVEKLPDDEKIKTEGNLINFYLEMIKFLRDDTPYSDAQAYCEDALEERVRNIKLNSLNEISRHNITDTYDNFIFEYNQKKAASLYLSAILKELVGSGSSELASEIIKSKLIGNGIDLTTKDIADYYIPNVSTKPKKPRLLFCSAHWLTGGMERVMSIIFTQLKDEYDIFLLTAYDGRTGKIEVPAYVNHIKISNDLFYNSYDVTALAHVLLLDIDVVIGFTNLINGQLDLYKLCAELGIKTIASNHEIYFYPYSSPYFYKLIKKRIDVYREVDATLWLTNFSAAAYGLASSNSYLMPNPNTYQIQRQVREEKEKIILCVGRFNDYVKRVDRMLECFSIVSKTHPDARIVFVGTYDKDIPILPNDSTTIQTMIKKLNIDESKISFVGEVDNVDKYYTEANILLLTSMNEGFGMVINEAACFGVPTVANYIPGLEDLIIDGKNGYLVEQGDVEKMAEVVNNVFSDKNLRKELSQNALSMVSRFDRVEIGERWKFLISVLLDTDNEKHKRLNKKLSYKIDNYSSFSGELFDEMNKMVAVNLGEIKDNPGNVYARLFLKLSKKVATAKKLMRRKGVKGVADVLIEKVSIITNRRFGRR